ncbi:ABC transporter substrate-binding protein [Falsiroseomonas tokyonensis]|uniref:ABC transporter substrate-binding protein n=1 Tax=Falsiroseomonas tokyonensis TaxID=430521 RepID=A0ABV7C2P2_9PROT|nr:ABC transporter substrate-binding protein [Falsiroseomonas tokyonensis]
MAWRAWAVGLAFCLIAALPGAARAERVKLVVLPFLSQAPIFIALEEGLFAEEGITIEPVALSSSHLAVPGLMTGDLDAAIPQASPALFNAVARGGRARLVASGVVLAPGECSYAAFYGTGLTMAELTSGQPRSLRISAEPNAFEGFLVDLLRQRPGAERLQVSFREMPVAAQQSALGAGALDLAFLSEPWVARLDQAGIGRVAVGGEHLLPGGQFTALMFSERMLADGQALGRRFLRAYRAALARYNAGKTPRNLEILARATRLPPELLARACWPSMPVDARLQLDSLMTYQQWLRQRQLIDRVLTPGELVAEIAP